MGSKTVKVISYTYTNTTFYAEYHPNFPLPIQARRIKKSFAASGGTSLEIFADQINDIRIDYDGALTIFSEPQNDRYLAEFCYGVDANIINFPRSAQDFQLKLQHSQEIKNSVVCLPGGGYNLHHFIFEILPSLLSFRDEVKIADSLVLGATPGAKFLQEFNEIFKLNANLTLIPLNSTLRISNSTNISAIPFRIYPIDLINDIREEVASVIRFADSNKSEIVFIGRQDLDRNRRVLTNEQKVIEILRGTFKDILIIRPGVSKLSETVQAIQRARILIGPTGGSLAHLIWARNLEVFIEIVPDGYYGDTETEELSKLMNFKYFRINSDSLPNQEWNYSDQECNLNELTNLLTHSF
jgi:capsular polysaccharide biosynthesis protein